MNFKVGQMCYVGSAGVGKITEQVTKVIDGKNENYWKVELKGQAALIPVSRAMESMRDIMSSEKSLEIFDILFAPAVPFDTRPFDLKKADYMHSFQQTGLDPTPMAMLFRALLSAPAELSMGEKKFVLFFEDLLIEEVAVARGIPFAEFMQKLKVAYPTAYLGL